MEQNSNINTFTAAINEIMGYASTRLHNMQEKCVQTRDTIKDFERNNEILMVKKTNYGVVHAYKSSHCTKILVMDFDDYRLTFVPDFVEKAP